MTHPEMAVKTVTGKKILDDLSGYLEFAIDERLPGEDVSQEVVQQLRSKAPAVNLLPKKPSVAAPVPVKSTASRNVPPAKPVSKDDAVSGLKQIAEAVKLCKKCGLHSTRLNVVPGQGDPTPEIMFIGEAPGADEDEQGLAFVGRAGQLLTKMIEAMGYKREEVFIGNILKCRPPDNRPPMPDEMVVCIPYLKEQIKMLRPKVIVALGGTAMMGLLGLEGISKLRGVWHEFEGIPLMPTYHPAYLLRNSSGKKFVWNDLKAVLEKLGRKPPEPKKQE